MIKVSLVSLNLCRYLPDATSLNEEGELAEDALSTNEKEQSGGGGDSWSDDLTARLEALKKNYR